MPSHASDIAVSDLQGGQSYWRALYYFNLYRLALATGLSTIAFTRPHVALLGAANPLLFQGASLAMLVLAVLSLITITTSWPAFRVQAYGQFSLDAVLITLMSHASGGVGSGLNLLLIASVAAGGVLLSGRMSLFFAAFATVLALIQQSLELLYFPLRVSGQAFIQVGLLGVGFFSTGWIVYWLARRFHLMEAEAQTRAAATARLDRLNEAIVAQSTVGIAVIGSDRRARLVNDRARHLLDLSIGTQALPEALTTSALEHARGRDRFSFDQRSAAAHLRVHGLRIDEHQDEVVLFLEDLSAAERAARNLKLAALGRLTASVAHEIRNPLTAISHAGQLLAESPDLSDQQARLVRIVDTQGNRIEKIVKAILQLGRPGAVQRVSLALRPWLEQFRETFQAGHDLGDELLAIDGAAPGAQVDPDQLNQILTNLCDNALRHSRHLGERPLITLHCSHDPERGMVTLDIHDRGPGVPADIREQVFEPFFTTHHAGHGLGLYLARELAQNNHGELEYVERGSGGWFRLSLEAGAAPARESGQRTKHD